MTIPVPPGLHTCPDATIWARYFMAVKAENPGIADDEATMATWFSNAMMAMHDSRAQSPAPATVEVTEGMVELAAKEMCRQEWAGCVRTIDEAADRMQKWPRYSDEARKILIAALAAGK